MTALQAAGVAKGQRDSISPFQSGATPDAPAVAPGVASVLAAAPVEPIEPDERLHRSSRGMSGEGEATFDLVQTSPAALRCQPCNHEPPAMSPDQPNCRMCEFCIQPGSPCFSDCALAKEFWRATIEDAS